MSLEELQPHELMQKVAGFFESLMISYRVVGSMASMAYGEPRLTIDIDMVADLKMHHVASLCANFTMPIYYLSESAVREAVLMNSQFNLIRIPSGLKVEDLYRNGLNLNSPQPQEFGGFEARVNLMYGSVHPKMCCSIN